MQKKLTLSILACACLSTAMARDTSQQIGDATVAAQNAALEKNTDGKGFGPQSPRDIGFRKGLNTRIFATAPAYQQMNLCNIHFHKNAEHKGGEFTALAEDAHGHGSYSGYKYSGKLSAAESKPLDTEVCQSEHGGLQAGDTIEMHYVHSTAQVVPGPTLNSCLSESLSNPQLRVEAQVFVLVNDPKAADFSELAKVGQVNGYHQALNIPKSTGRSIQYAGSTTGPAYNEKASPLQVSWSVRPRIMKINADSLGQWCKGNSFKEDHAHGVRNLVINEKLLSNIR
jgi:opacity protein-like surface antigen